MPKIHYLITLNFLIVNIGWVFKIQKKKLKSWKCVIFNSAYLNVINNMEKIHFEICIIITIFKHRKHEIFFGRKKNTISYFLEYSFFLKLTSIFRHHINE